MLKFRLILLFVVLLLIAGAGLYSVSARSLPEGVRQLLAQLQLHTSDGTVAVPQVIHNISVPKVSTEAAASLATLGDRAAEVGTTVGDVLGTAVQEASISGESTLQERAFDYGRYLYCKQVVEDYEQRQTTR